MEISILLKYCFPSSDFTLSRADYLSASSYNSIFPGIWPYKNLHHHILAICSRISVYHPDIVRRIAEENVINMLKKMTIPLYRSQLETLVLYLVYGNQESVSMVTQLCAHLPATLHSFGQVQRITHNKIKHYLRHITH